MKKFAVIVAVDEKMGIGRLNALPWRLSGDMQRFKDVTIPCSAGKQNAVVMGRKTWESLPLKYRPLPGRLNVVLSSKPVADLSAGVLQAGSFDAALTLLDGRDDVADVFIIGGGVVFEQAMRHKGCNRLYLTQIMGDFFCDVFFPSIPPDFHLVRSSESLKENGVVFRFSDFEKEISFS